MSKENPAKGDFIEQTLSVWDHDYEDVDVVFEIHSWYDFPRGADGFCALCKGDPCAELGDGLIALVREATKRNFETCPVCKGRAS